MTIAEENGQTTDRNELLIRQDMTAALVKGLAGLFSKWEDDNIYDAVAQISKSAFKRGQWQEDRNATVGRNSVKNIIRNLVRSHHDPELHKFRNTYLYSTCSYTDDYLDYAFNVFRSLGVEHKAKTFDALDEIIRFSFSEGTKARDKRHEITYDLGISTW